MADKGNTLLEIVNHIVVSHPELAGAIEELAIRAQGRTTEDLFHFREWKFGQDQGLEGVFSRVYAEGHWGRSADQAHPFYSGSGSHEDSVVATYVDAIRAFIQELGGTLSAVDLGCGDFNVGARIRPLFGNYIAGDVVPALIESNRKSYSALDVDFRQIDLTRDEIPSADVILVRQVLQHLSNRDIMNFVSRVSGRCRYLVITEHLPLNDDFRPNIDKPSGPNIRLKIGSGVVLSKEPFNLKVTDERTLCTVTQGDGRIVTTAYQLA